MAAIMLLSDLSAAAEKVLVVVGSDLEEETQQSLKGSIANALKDVLHSKNVELKFYTLNPKGERDTSKISQNHMTVMKIKQYQPDALVLVHNSIIKDVGVMTDNVPLAFTWLFGDEIDQGLLCRL